MEETTFNSSWFLIENYDSLTPVQKQQDLDESGVSVLQVPLLLALIYILNSLILISSL